MQRKVTFIDLFPNITEELREEIAERKRLWNAYKLDPENLEEPPKTNVPYDKFRCKTQKSV
ncbi:hypothetical protein PSTG_05332 [Puccinia striiformis f. sp. tritici PST-78]|uniref:Uncharacterized protein n=1 Tax=Puccinia striiformis f. sp. tritici PST-78 TaxID=1165861 RepID=A0A0L0VQS9_9BASI|nr:hypothetical protein PSTG_05332 [Puccinia striiformis f. sp. tritici PST-78]